MRDIWESYSLVEFYMLKVHEKLKMREIEPLSLTPLTSSHHKTYSSNNTFGAIDHLRRKANSRRALVDAVGAFEHYMSYLVYLVYRDYPERMQTKGGTQSSDQEVKLIDLIIDSADKAEILERISEERIRAIFYGKPLDFFLKDRARLEFRDYYTTTESLPSKLKLYEEVAARRNLIVHNGGKVDRKYLREVEGSTIRLGEQAPLTPEYLRTSIALLLGLASTVGVRIMLRIYNENILQAIPNGHLSQSYRQFINTP